MDPLRGNSNTKKNIGETHLKLLYLVDANDGQSHIEIGQWTQRLPRDLAWFSALQGCLPGSQTSTGTITRILNKETTHPFSHFHVKNGVMRLSAKALALDVKGAFVAHQEDGLQLQMSLHCGDLFSGVQVLTDPLPQMSCPPLWPVGHLVQFPQVFPGLLSHGHCLVSADPEREIGGLFQMYISNLIKTQSACLL